MIDRTDAIKVLEDGDWWDELSEWYMVANPEYNALHDALDAAIAALREQEQRKWISVKDETPPEDDTEYEVCCDYHGERRIEIHKGWNMHGVTHWRPLPKLPKEGVEE